MAVCQTLAEYSSVFVTERDWTAPHWLPFISYGKMCLKQDNLFLMIQVLNADVRYCVYLVVLH